MKAGEFLLRRASTGFLQPTWLKNRVRNCSTMMEFFSEMLNLKQNPSFLMPTTPTSIVHVHKGWSDRGILDNFFFTTAVSSNGGIESFKIQRLL